MSKKNFINGCKYSVDYMAAASKTELNLFCEIMGLPKSKVNYFIGDDPHGVVDIMEGYRYFNMTDIHVVISEYEHWMSIYKTNEELRKAVDAWYYYCQEWHEQHSMEKNQWINVYAKSPEFHTPVYARTKPGDEFYAVLSERRGWYDIQGRKESPKVTEWKPIPSPRQEAERSKGCPNLRSWLAGCPVEGLRDATLEWQTQQERDLQAAHKRVEECKQALEDAIKEEVKLNKF